MEQEEVIENILKPYVSIKSSDYYVRVGHFDKYLGSIFIGPHKEAVIGGRNMNIVSQDLVNLTSPDFIDSRTFWYKAVKDFPLYSICGNPSCKNIEDVNRETFFGLHVPALKWIFEDGIKKDSSYKMLEIGPGYGNVCMYVEYKHPNVEYYGLDVNPLFDHERMFHGDGKTIPELIPELDIVYSVNVFQHLSKNQRESYYKQVYDKLKPGGKFIIGTFCVTENNINHFGWADEDENLYTFFLGQFTIVERYSDWKNNLEKIGFKFLDKQEIANYVTLYLEK